MKSCDDDSIIAGIYDAAIDASLWPAVLELAVRRFRASHSVVHTPLVVAANGGLFFSYNVSPEAIEAHDKYYRALDLWTHGHQTKFAGRGGFLGEMFVSFRDLTRSEFYTDFLRPQQLHHFCAAVVHGRSGGGQLLSFGMFRGPRQPAFEEADRLLSERLSLHIQRAAMISERLQSRELGRRTDRSMLDLSAAAIFLVDRSGRVVRMTAPAERHLRKGTHIRLVCGRLAGIVDPAALEAAIRAAATEQGHAYKSTLLVLLDESGRNRRHVLVAQAGMDARGLVYVIMAPAGSTHGPDFTSILCKTYGLTPAEGRLCALLKSGLSLQEAAERLSIRRSTAVSQLKSVFFKTDTVRQSDLMRVLLDLGTLSSSEAYPPDGG
jgi:DNA-binding CsgD family transcriptional regulator